MCTCEYVYDIDMCMYALCGMYMCIHAGVLCLYVWYVCMYKHVWEIDMCVGICVYVYAYMYVYVCIVCGLCVCGICTVYVGCVCVGILVFPSCSEEPL